MSGLVLTSQLCWSGGHYRSSGLLGTHVSVSAARTGRHTVCKVG